MIWICDECLEATRDKCEKDISLKPKKECLIAYLEKIKAEILEHHCIKCYGTCETYCPYSDCIEPKDVIEDLQIIDKYIEELKGENNEYELF